MLSTIALILLAGANPLEMELKDLAGSKAPLGKHAGPKGTVVMFLQFDCPISAEYSAQVIRLGEKYQSQGVGFVGVLADEEAGATLAKKASGFGLKFPLLHDRDFKLADALGAKITPEVFLLDEKGKTIYSGRIDDTWTARLRRNPAPKNNDLADALEALLIKKPIRVMKTEAVGCPIERPQRVATGAQVTYHRDIAPIFQEKCQSCHRPGEVAPFPLTGYGQALRWKDLLVEVVEKRQMPPWLPGGGYHFRGERRLTDVEIQKIRQWVKEGCAEGDFAAAPLPRQFPEGWQLGKPDLILELPEEMIIGPEGKDLFRCFALPTNLTEDKHVVAYELRPGNRRVVHHTLHFLDTQGRGRKLEAEAKASLKEKAADRGPGYTVAMGVGFSPSGEIGGWAPGISAKFLPENTAYFLPKGADFILQIHYHRTGKEEKDRTRVGLYFAKQPASRFVQPLVIPGSFLVIPPNKPDFKVKNTVWLAKDALLHSVDPHMHLLGRTFVMHITEPGADKVEAIRIDDWDYNWQEIYFLKEPRKLKAGTRIDIEAVFDNSSSNPNNPSTPPVWVRFGEQTTNEMCFMFLGLTTDDNMRIQYRREENGPVLGRKAKVGPP